MSAKSVDTYLIKLMAACFAFCLLGCGDPPPNPHRKRVEIVRRVIEDSGFQLNEVSAPFDSEDGSGGSAKSVLYELISEEEDFNRIEERCREALLTELVEKMGAEEFRVAGVVRDPDGSNNVVSFGYSWKEGTERLILVLVARSYHTMSNGKLCRAQVLVFGSS